MKIKKWEAKISKTASWMLANTPKKKNVDSLWEERAFVKYWVSYFYNIFILKTF